MAFRCFILLQLFMSVLSEISQQSHLSNSGSRYLSKLTRDQIHTNVVIGKAGILAVNISFPAIDNNVTLSLKADSSTIDGPYVRITLVDYNYEPKKNKTLFKKPNNCFVGFVEGGEGRHANAVLMAEDLWFVSFDGPDGSVFTLEPELRRSILKNAVPSASLYVITGFYKRKSKTPDIRQQVKQQPLTRPSEEALEENKVKISEQKIPLVANKVSTRIQTRLTWEQRPAVSCNVLVITDYRIWGHLGIDDPISLSHFLTFAFKQVDRYLTTGQSMDLHRARLRIGNISIFDTYASHFLTEKLADVHASSSAAISEMLCSLRLHQDYKDYCLLHLITPYDLGGFFGGSMFPSEVLSGDASQHEDQPAWRPGTTEPRDQPRAIGVSSLVGCHQRMLPMGVFLPLLARQIRHSLHECHDGKSSNHLSCNARETGSERELLSFHTETLDRDLCQHDVPDNPQSAGSRRKGRKVRSTRSRLLDFCGDGKLNPDSEVCDPGSLGELDPCCSEKCKLRPSASCSPAHHPCCTRDCQIAPTTQRCNLEMSSEYNPCVRFATFCDGIDPTLCLRSRMKITVKTFSSLFLNVSDGSRCGRDNVCSAGLCLSFCEATEIVVSNASSTLETCTCNPLSENGYGNNESSCFRCCSESDISRTSCNITRGRHSDGYPCVIGYCPELGCIRLHAKSEWRDERGDFRAISMAKPENKQKKESVSYDTLAVIFRSMYWIVTCGLFLSFLIFTTAINVGVCKAEEGRAPTTEAPPSTGFNVGPSTGFNAGPCSGFNAGPSTGFNAGPSTGPSAGPSAGPNTTKENPDIAEHKV